MDLRNVKKTLSQDEQVSLQKEMAQLDMIIKGYEEENRKLMKNSRQQEQTVKELNEKLTSAEREIKDYRLKAIKEKNGVFIEEDDDEVDIQAKNVMGTKSAISQKQLDEIQQKLKELQVGNDNAKKDLALQASQFKQQIQKIRDEKNEVEKLLFDTEFLLGNKD